MRHRNRVRFAPAGLLLAFFLASLPGILLAADPEGAATQAKPANPPKELHITPAPAPVPALRYRLLPLESERTPGDAAPIYIRLSVGLTEKERREIQEGPAKWLEMPLDRFPIAEVRKFIDRWPRKIEQVQFGSRRQSCNWNYTLSEEAERTIEIMLPDAQEMRLWVRLVALKARIEIAEHKYDDAIRTLETGFAFARHLGEGPFYINALIGLATARVMLDRVEELIAQPDAPNLYWALTALPRPFLDLRKAIEIDQTLFERLIPELTSLDKPRTDAEWAALLARLHARLESLRRYVDQDNRGQPAPVKQDLAGFKAELLPEARAHFKGKVTDDQAVILYVAGQYRELYDDLYKLAYLPYPDAAPLYAGPNNRLRALMKKGLLGVVAALVSNIEMVFQAEGRVDCEVAALRCIEAIRLHAASHEGSLPGSLDRVTIVPIPYDPMTGKPVVYRREGEVAVLVFPAVVQRPGPRSVLMFPEEGAPKPGLTYRVVLRK